MVLVLLKEIEAAQAVLLAGDNTGKGKKITFTGLLDFYSLLPH